MPKGGALVSSAPLDLFDAPLVLLVHHLLCWCIACFVGASLALFGAPLALLVHHLFCWCTTCFVGAPLALLVHRLHCWCINCFVGALETSAPPLGDYSVLVTLLPHTGNVVTAYM